MAGIYERIKPTAADRLSVHRIIAVLEQLTPPSPITAQQALTALNEVLQSALTAAEITDLKNVFAQLTAATDKVKYFHRAESTFILAEQGSSLITEAVFRSRLNIA